MECTINNPWTDDDKLYSAVCQGKLQYGLTGRQQLWLHSVRTLYKDAHGAPSLGLHLLANQPHSTSEERKHTAELITDVKCTFLTFMWMSKEALYDSLEYDESSRKNQWKQPTVKVFVSLLKSRMPSHVYIARQSDVWSQRWKSFCADSGANFYDRRRITFSHRSKLVEENFLKLYVLTNLNSTLLSWRRVWHMKMKSECRLFSKKKWDTVTMMDHFTKIRSKTS